MSHDFVPTYFSCVLSKAMKAISEFCFLATVVGACPESKDVLRDRILESCPFESLAHRVAVDLSASVIA